MYSLKNIVIISAVFPPEPLVSASMALDLANYLTKKNVTVTVLCPQPSRPMKVAYGQYCTTDGSSILSKINGITVIRLATFASPQSRIFTRMLESYSLGRHACRYLSSQIIKPNVIYVNVWPLLGQALIARYSKKHKIPMVLQIMDIYPESLLNKIRNPLHRLLSPPLIYLDRWIAQQASCLSVISSNMQHTYVKNRKISLSKVHLIPLWQDEVKFETIPDRTDACSKYGIDSDLFTFLYLGNIGPVAGVEFLIQAFYNAKLTSAQLIIVGGGSSEDICKKLAECIGVKNVKFINDPNSANVPLLQSMAHVCLLPARSGAAMSSIPSKLVAYLFSAVPILASVDLNSYTAQIIKEADCGWVGRPEDLDWLAAKMKEVCLLPSVVLCKKGRDGKRFGLSNFSKSVGVKRLAQVVMSAIKKIN